MAHGFVSTSPMINVVTMISLEDFKQASVENKCDVLTKHSTYIAVRHSGNDRISLFTIYRRISSKCTIRLPTEK